ncbi:pyrrolo-quinoline quinone [Natronococcus amylolyticus DSM 10524]|uniref:Pyrrolo-quinoline quinone n=1 Tax=Natronococcus amylolyticus DSM 10524 TaxID=1227497 RepID=L9XCL8_9EURY|nr:PQQ-binding-like beta-propeller repeat protein [Natronococcus amylolyticus]ELY59459.1 pyrrolo-quinoline quinone [Natronococcus amylolyticus DSM 10524]
MTDWNQFKRDPQHSGVRRDLEGPDRPESAWTVELAGTAGSPVLDRDTVYVGTTRGNLYALDRETGRRRWVFESTDGIDATPVATYDGVYAATDAGTVHAIDPGTGDALWRTKLPAPLESDLAFADGRLYAGHTAGLSALEAGSGEIGWTYETDAAAAGSPVVAADRPRVYVGTADEQVRCLEDGSDGVEETWSAPTDGVVAAPLTIADGRVYVADDDGTLLALDTETGQTWFSYEIRGAFTSSATVLPEEGTTFVGADDGYLHVTDTRFGRRKVRGWLFSKKGIALDGEVDASPVVAGDVVCVGDSTGSLYGVDATDYDLRWHVDLGAPVSRTPALAPGRLYVAAADELSSLEWATDEPTP